MKLSLQRSDQKWGTRKSTTNCTIAAAFKRTYGIPVTVQGGKVRERGLFGGRIWTLGSDGESVVAAHDSGRRVGVRSISLSGPDIPTRTQKRRVMQPVPAPAPRVKPKPAPKKAKKPSEKRTRWW